MVLIKQPDLVSQWSLVVFWLTRQPFSDHQPGGSWVESMSWISKLKIQSQRLQSKVQDHVDEVDLVDLVELAQLVLFDCGWGQNHETSVTGSSVVLLAVYGL